MSKKKNKNKKKNEPRIIDILNKQVEEIERKRNFQPPSGPIVLFGSEERLAAVYESIKETIIEIIEHKDEIEKECPSIKLSHVISMLDDILDHIIKFMFRTTRHAYCHFRRTEDKFLDAFHKKASKRCFQTYQYIDYSDYTNKNWSEILNMWKLRLENERTPIRIIGGVPGCNHHDDMVELWKKILLIANYLESFCTEDIHKNNELTKLHNFEYCVLTYNK